MKYGLLLCLLTWAGVLQAQAPHPLEGRLWAIADARFLSPEQLFEQLPAGGWLLLGEQHDHPQHHQIQTEWILALAARQQLGAVALEMADHSQQGALDQALGHGQTITPEALQWQSGWPWSLYGEVVSTALDHATAVAAADLTRDEQRAAYRHGAPEGELEHDHTEFMAELLFDSHCGQLPRQSLDGMRQVQLARDQQMARVLSDYADVQRTGVMLTGAIHARRDLGIPRWLALPATSVLMIAVNDDTAPANYLPTGLPGRDSADYLLFTRALPGQDHCAEFEG
ncbi:MAG: ChaN family lipoprotein [Oceanospirillales bacterium]|uniref:Putative iron-regulated protein n=1 Tax=Marinobacterium halophilum TaxID=267374 RepID=A0A2P8ETB1_9GAMM|nr:ChaN family lipoprotein [Marinobacterium halophilum]MBR9827834.1 ChaN family lipoprotein [Oceanospirillales bacterium]PSL12711.1 putative iron-regulated protein [Marinobacterium halophilum]